MVTLEIEPWLPGQCPNHLAIQLHLHTHYTHMHTTYTHTTYAHTHSTHTNTTPTHTTHSVVGCVLYTIMITVQNNIIGACVAILSVLLRFGAFQCNVVENTLQGFLPLHKFVCILYIHVKLVESVSFSDITNLYHFKTSSSFNHTGFCVLIMQSALVWVQDVMWTTWKHWWKSWQIHSSLPLINYVCLWNFRHVILELLIKPSTSIA